jgi:hypothetical protein
MKNPNKVTTIVIFSILLLLIMNIIISAAEPVDCWVYWSVCSRGCENTFPENPTNCYNWCVDAMTRMGCY